MATICAEFRPGYVPEETILRLTGLPQERIHDLYNELSLWVNEQLDIVRHLGMAVPSMGEVFETFAWVDEHPDYGQASVNIDEGYVELYMLNSPEGEDVLDPTHPDWYRPRDTMWIDLLPKAKRIVL